MSKLIILGSLFVFLLSSNTSALVLSTGRLRLRMGDENYVHTRKDFISSFQKTALLFATSVTTNLLNPGEARAVGKAKPQQVIRLPPENQATELENMPALKGLDYGKPRSKYGDFTSTSSGIQYKDVKIGSGSPPSKGDRVVIDWNGYTIGYYGRPFQMKNSVKGGAFEGDTDFLRFSLGDGTVIPGLEEGVAGMREGGIRQIIVPAEMGYPQDDRGHNRVGPKPSTFSGERALDFVLRNQGLIDKTLLFQCELRRIDRPGQRGYKRT